MRLDKRLIAQHPGLSRRQAQRAIEQGQVDVDGVVVSEAGHEVTDQASVSFDPNRPALPRARLRLPILYQDEDMLIVDKPAGLLSVPTDAREGPSALDLVKQWAARGATPDRFAERVHRLDRDTSGALLFALSREARARLIDLFAAHRIERRYLALVARAPEGEEGRIDAPIRSEWTGGRRGIAAPHEESLPALTLWKVVRRVGRGALLEVELHTGRQHQIRAHLAHAGLPILGDGVYGVADGRTSRQMLHAHVLGVTSPSTGRLVRVEAPVPPDMREAIRRLETSAAPRARREALRPSRARSPRSKKVR